MKRIVGTIVGVIVAAAHIITVAEPYAYTPTPANTTDSAYRMISSVCKIEVRDGWRSSWAGSGTLIAVQGDQALILTCRHVCTKKGMDVTVKWPLSGQVSPGKVVDVVEGVRFRSDLALVVCQRPKGLRPILIAPTFSADAGPWYAIGWRDGLLRLAIASNANQKDSGLIEVNAAFIGGMSGGPVINKHGRLIGVAVGSDLESSGVVADGEFLDTLLRKWGYDQ